jgi:hypothetical protein
MTDAPLMMVDRLAERAHRDHSFKLSCHMTTMGTVDDLHAFALRLGLREEWYAEDPIPHYILSPKLRAKALMLGAVELTE